MKNINDTNRQVWIKGILERVPKGSRLLDAGAGELRNRKNCSHLDYVSQDFCQYRGNVDGAPQEGLQNPTWDTSKIDIVSDIVAIPASDASFDVVLCTEVLEHIPEPTHALDEFARLLKPGGLLILTAPFASFVHMAPYHFCSGFSKYWYEYHLPLRGFAIIELIPNGDWNSFLMQEISRLGGLERKHRNWSWPLAYLYGLLGGIYFGIRSKKYYSDLACFGWHVVARKI